MAEAVECCASISFTPLIPSRSISDYGRALTRPVLQVQWEKFTIVTFSGSALDLKSTETEANALLGLSQRSSSDEIGGVGRIRQQDLSWDIQFSYLMWFEVRGKDVFVHVTFPFLSLIYIRWMDRSQSLCFPNWVFICIFMIPRSLKLIKRGKLLLVPLCLCLFPDSSEKLCLLLLRTRLRSSDGAGECVGFLEPARKFLVCLLYDMFDPSSAIKPSHP